MTLPQYLFNVLAVDDREENLELLEAIIEAPDVRVYRASSGEEALSLTESTDFALAILDVQMPGMSGFDLATKLGEQERTRELPLLFLTAVHEPSWQGRGYEVGAVDFLVKPVSPDLLRYRVRALLELRRHRLVTEETLRINELFVGVLAHDLRSPLSAVITGAGLLTQTSDPSTVKIAERIRSSGLRMASLIDQLADLTRIRLGNGLPLTKGDCELRAILDRTVQELAVVHPDRAFRIEPGEPIRGHWDKERLEQVVSNLLGNAVRHGEPSAPIRAHARVEGGQAQLWVTNAGTIPSESLATLFEPFKQGKAGERREGLGLGLYIVEQIVRAHGGDVEVTSENGETTFFVRLPLRVD